MNPAPKLTSLADVKRRRPSDPERVRTIRRSLELQGRLRVLRDRAGVSQEAVAGAMGTSRPNVVRIEQEDDVRISTLARYVEALGGELEIRVTLEGESVLVVGPDDERRP